MNLFAGFVLDSSCSEGKQLLVPQSHILLVSEWVMGLRRMIRIRKKRVEAEKREREREREKTEKLCAPAHDESAERP